MRQFGLSLLMILLALSFTLDANAQRKKKKRKQKGDVEIVVPCTGPEFMTNNQYIRATGMALSNDMSVAKKKCMAAARSEIALAIEAKVKTVTDQYVSSYQMGEEDETKQRFEEMTRQAAKQTLSGLRIICDKMMKTPEGKYRAYVTLELAGKDLLNTITDDIMKDDKLRVDFEYEKFKEVFEEEMQNYTE